MRLQGGSPAAEAPLRILLVEASADDAAALAAQLDAAGLRVRLERVETPDAMAHALASAEWDAVLSDYALPGFSAREALALLQDAQREIPFILVSNVIGEAQAVALARAGATDFVAKQNLGALRGAIERGLREAATRRARNEALQALQESEARFKAIASNLPGMVFQSLLDARDRMRFLFVSDGCEALLGLAPEALLANPARFTELILAEDRESYRAALRALRREGAVLNWEGRIRVPRERDVKWINLRARVRALPLGQMRAEGIALNVSERRRVEARLRASQAQLRELSSHLQSVKEQERAAIAREIHDDFGSLLTAAKIDLLWLAKRLPPDEALAEKAQSALSQIERTLDSAQRIARSLRPGVLDFGVAAAIEWQAKEFQKRMGIPCRLARLEDEIPASAELATALFRVFQEALNNVAKHAGASSVEVALYSESGNVCLEITDDGCGIREADASKPGAFGLRSMRERIEHFGGTLGISGAPQAGTRLVVRVPLALSTSLPEQLELGAPA